MVGTGYSRLIFAIVCVLSTLTLRAQFDPRAEIKRTDTGGFRGVEEKDGYVYVVDGSRTLVVFDLRDLTAEGAFASYSEPIGRIEEAGGSNLIRNGDYLYAAGYGLYVYDISTPATPVYQRTISSPRIDNGVLAGDRLYLVGHDYLATYSIDDPSTPELRGQIALDGGSGYSVAVSGTMAYVSEWLSASQIGRLRIVDAADIDNLVDRRAIDQEDVAFHLDVQDEELIAFESSRVRVYSLADPTRPVEMDNLPAGARAAKASCGFLVTNGRIFRVTKGRLEQILQFDPGGGQPDGAPHGAVARDDFIFLVQRERVLILSTPPALTFPQYVTGQADGSPNRTRIILRNAGPLPQNGTIVFRNASGVAQTVTLGGTSTQRFGFDLAPLGNAGHPNQRTGQPAVRATRGARRAGSPRSAGRCRGFRSAG